MKANLRNALYLILVVALGEIWLFLPRASKDEAKIFVLVVVFAGLAMLLAHNKRKYGLFFPGPMTQKEVFAQVARNWPNEIGESLSYLVCLLLAAVLTGLFLSLALRISGNSLSAESWFDVFAAVSLPLGALLMYMLARYRERY
jgi:hypothetical protein